MSAAEQAERATAPLRNTQALLISVFLIAAPIIDVIRANPGAQIGLAEVATFILVQLATLILVAATLARVMRSARLGNLLVALSVAALVFFSFEGSGLQAIIRSESALAVAAVAWLGLCMAIGWSVVWLIGRPNGAAAVMVAALLFVMVPVAGSLGVLWQRADFVPAREAGPARPVGGPGPLPNVYWIVLDAYPDRRTIARDFGESDQSFERDLRERGFRVLDGVQSNYPSTRYSMASMLAMDYVLTQDSPRAEVVKERTTWNSIRGRNAVSRELEELGYEYIRFTNGFDFITQCAKPDTHCYSGRARLDRLTVAMFGRTPLVVVPKSSAVAVLIKRLLFPSEWRAADELLDYLDRIRAHPSPRFLYAHVMSPHPPFRHARDCSFRESEPSLSSWSKEMRPLFLDEIVCLNQQVNTLVDEILVVEPDAMIIINGDHGPAFREQGVSEPSAWTREAFEERFGVLLALRLPARCTGGLEGLRSLVNVHRFLLACLRRQEPVLLDDRYFVTPYEDHPSFGAVVEYRRDGAPVEGPDTDGGP